jgi:hypothetical protein
MRLRHPELGTVVEVGDDLEPEYRARGWVDADKRRRSTKKDADEDASGNDHAG